MKKVWDAVKLHARSRKFQVMMVGIMGSLTGWLNGQVSPDVALVAIVGLITAYMAGISYEDGQAKSNK